MFLHTSSCVLWRAVAVAITLISANGSLIQRVNTDKAMYAPGNPVTIYIDLQNLSSTSFNGTVTLYFRHLGETAGADQVQSSSVPAGSTGVLSYQWQPPATDFRGYLVEAWARNASGEILDYAVTAVDVSSTWSKFPRYGFLTHFGTSDDVEHLLWQMKNFHINGVQFYDWMDSHHVPYSQASTWQELSKRQVNAGVLRRATDAARGYRMTSMAYNLMNGGYDAYWADGSGVQLAWGLFKRAGGGLTPADQDCHPLPSSWETSKLYQFNPASQNWQTHLSSSMKTALEVHGFDGWHIDTLGYRGPLYTWEGNAVPLEETFPNFIEGVKARMNVPLLVNLVGGFGRTTVPGHPGIEFIYNELWDDPDTDDYYDLKTLTENYLSQTGKTPVYAAYINYNCTTGLVSPGWFNEASVFLASATLFASGASHMELGDGLEMVSGPYFPSQPLKMSSSLQARLLDYYHFLTAYQNLLRDGVTPADLGFWIQDATHSYYGEPGKVWMFSRRKPGLEIAHLINLQQVPSSKWRDTYAVCPQPQILNNRQAKFYYNGAWKPGARLWCASPDRDHGKTYQLAYTLGSDGAGTFIQVTVPSLEYWTMLWWER